MAWPSAQIRAAVNLQFAMREAIWALGLDRDALDQQSGEIHLNVFDTNNPIGHEDFPPHIHMFLQWPNVAGSQATHFYIDDRSLLADNRVVLLGLEFWGGKEWHPRESFATVDPKGRRMFTHTVTKEGHLRIERARGGACVLKPVGSGFDTGVLVEREGRAGFPVQANDDTQGGELRVQVGKRAPEIYRYDPDIGVLTGEQPVVAH